MCPAPQYLKCMAALVCRSPPFIHFIPMLWAVLACVAIPYYWKLLEPPGTPRILLDVPCPPVPEMYGCTGVQVPPPFIHFIPMLWAVLACVAIPYYWKLLEPPGTPRILLDVPHPQYLKCMAALVCRSPPFHTFYSHALGCVGMRCHSPYYWKLLEPPGTYRTLGFSWMCPAPQYLKCMAALVCRSPPLSYILFPCSGLCWHALPFSTSGNYWNHLEPIGP